MAYLIHTHTTSNAVFSICASFMRYSGVQPCPPSAQNTKLSSSISKVVPEGARLSHACYAHPIYENVFNQSHLHTRTPTHTCKYGPRRLTFIVFVWDRFAWWCIVFGSLGPAGMFSVCSGACPISNALNANNAMGALLVCIGLHMGYTRESIRMLHGPCTHTHRK